jgi:hypothetical protein
MNMSRDSELIGDVLSFQRRGEACVLTIKRTFGHGRLAPTEHRLLNMGGW